MNQLNAHEYDGKLKEHVIRIVAKYGAEQEKHKWTFQETIKDIKAQANIDKYDNTKMPLLLRALDMVGLQTQENYDPSNNAHFDQLLVLLWNGHMKQPNAEWDASGRGAVYDQLVEILGGACAQGRVNRIIQLFEGMY
jgi:hypothetical protein